MNDLPYYIYGSGGQGKCVIDAARQCGHDIAAVLDDAPKASYLLGVPVFPAAEALRSDVLHNNAFRFTVAIGECAPRRRIFQALLAINGHPQTIIHPRAWVSPAASVGAGSVIFAGTIVDPDVQIGCNALLNLGAIVGHDCQVGAHSHISGNCSLAGGTIIEDGVWFGIGSTTIQRVRIGRDSTIGAASLVTRDIPPGVLAKGRPAHHDMRAINRAAPESPRSIHILSH